MLYSIFSQSEIFDTFAYLVTFLYFIYDENKNLSDQKKLKNYSGNTISKLTSKGTTF